MFIVINKCFGGFGLSREALLELARLESPHINLINPAEYYGCDGEELESKIKECSEEDEELGLTQTVFYKDKVVDENYRHGSNEDWKARACPLLVRVVKKLGKKSWGHFAELKIVKIPDDVDFEIDDYDGVEHIAEKHRTWG